MGVTSEEESHGIQVRGLELIGSDRSPESDILPRKNFLKFSKDISHQLQVQKVNIATYEFHQQPVEPFLL